MIRNVRHGGVGFGCFGHGVGGGGYRLDRREKVRIGVFDSRAVAVAYVQSKSGQERFQQQFQQLKKSSTKRKRLATKSRPNASKLRAEPAKSDCINRVSARLR